MTSAPPGGSAGYLAGVPGRTVSYLGRPFMYPVGSEIGLRIAGGYEWDDVLRNLVPALVPEDEPVICEVGSNIGASLLQILAAKPRARVIAFEPSDRFRPFLERNLELTGLDHVEVLPFTAGRQPGTAVLYTDGTTGSVLTPGKLFGPQPTVVTTLDEVFRERGSVDFIKIDTDGFDFEVLRGAAMLLRRDRPILYFEFSPFEMASTPAIELRWLQDQGYRRFGCLGPGGQVVGITDDPQTLLTWAEERYLCDVVACPEGTPAAERLGQALSALQPAGPAGTCHTITVAEGVQFQVVVPAWDVGPLSQGFARGEHPFAPVVDLLLELLTPGATVLDLGAHVGSFSLLAAALDCHGIAVEASPINASRLKVNLARNRFERRVRVVSAAVGDRPGTVEFVPSGEFGMVANPNLTPGGIRTDILSTIEILQVTVDELLRDLGVERVDFIKMDIEGSEVAAVRGMRDLLGRPDAPPIFYESNGHTLWHFGSTPNQLLGALEELGYSNYRVDGGSLIPVQATDPQPETCVDYLALKRLPDRLRDERIRAPLTFEETVDRIVSESRQPHEHYRAYIARALASAAAAVRSDPQVRAALDRLRADEHPDVRVAAS